MRGESRSAIDDVIARIWPAPTSDTHMELCTKIMERALGKRALDISAYTDPRKFTVGEFCPKFNITEKNGLKDKTVYVTLIPSPFKSSEELMMRSLIDARAAKENGAEKVVLLATDFPSARQDRGPDEDDKAIGELNTARLYASLCRESGIDQVIVTHAHTPRLNSIFALEYGLVPRELMSDDAPRDLRKIEAPKHIDFNDSRIQELGKKVFKSISPHAILADYALHQSSLVGTKYLSDGGVWLVTKAMDAGNGLFVYDFNRALFLPRLSTINCKKARTAKNDPDKVEVEIFKVSENFETMDGKLEMFLDDGADTCGTLIKAALWSIDGNVCVTSGKSYGSPEDRFVYFSHAWLGGMGHKGIQERLVKNLPAREFVTSNTRPYISDEQYYRFKGKATVLRLAALWADALIANELGHDVTTRYQDFSCEEEQHEFVSSLYALKRHSWHFMAADSSPQKRRVRSLFFKLKYNLKNNDK